jgi:hypothetical protein
MVISRGWSAGIFGQAVLAPATVELPAVETPTRSEASLVSLLFLDGANRIPFAKFCGSANPHSPAPLPNLGYVHDHAPFLEKWLC